MNAVAQSLPKGPSRAESGFYSLLREWSGSQCPLQFIWQLINTLPATDDPEPSLWQVPSSSESGKFYLVDTEARLRTCDGFHFRHCCSHLRVANRATLLRYRLLNSADSETADSITHTSAPSAPTFNRRQFV